MLSKNHAARLKRVSRHLDTALDKVNQAAGELWPQELRSIGELVEKARDGLRTAHGQTTAMLQQPTEEDRPEDPPVDPDQEDIEDIEGVEQTQPRGRGRRAA